MHADDAIEVVVNDQRRHLFGKGLLRERSELFKSMLQDAIPLKSVPLKMDDEMMDCFEACVPYLQTGGPPA